VPDEVEDTLDRLEQEALIRACVDGVSDVEILKSAVTICDALTGLLLSPQRSPQVAEWSRPPQMRCSVSSDLCSAVDAQRPNDLEQYFARTPNGSSLARSRLTNS
jgi:hypothetical protein